MEGFVFANYILKEELFHLYAVGVIVVPSNSVDYENNYLEMIKNIL